MRPEELYLSDIVTAADAIAEFSADLSGLDDFQRDHKTQSAILQKLIIIGEAAARLSPEFRDRHTEIEGRDIIAFRNILIHSYFSIKLDIVWETVVGDVPKLREQVAQILAQEF